MNDGGALRRPAGVAGQDNALPIGQGPANRVPCFAPHDDGVPRGMTLEEFEIFWKVPWQATVFADDAICGHRDDGGKLDLLFQELNVWGEVKEAGRIGFQGLNLRGSSCSY